MRLPGLAEILVMGRRVPVGRLLKRPVSDKGSQGFGVVSKTDRAMPPLSGWAFLHFRIPPIAAEIPSRSFRACRKLVHELLK